MQPLLNRSPMFDEAREKKTGHLWIVELLIFLLVFAVAQSLQSLLFTPFFFIWLLVGSPFTEGIADGAQTFLENGDLSSYIAYVSDLVSETMAEMPDWLLILELFTTGAVTLTVILFCRLIEKRRASSLGLRRGRVFREYAVGLLAGAVMISAAVGLAALTGTMTVEKSAFGAASVFPWILYLIGYGIQGMSEEVLCRGYLMVSLSRRCPLWASALISSVVFACLHLANPGVTPLAVVNLTLSGLVFAVYVIRRGNLWGACAMHTIWNFLQGNLFGVRVSGMASSCSPLISSPVPGAALWNGGAFGIEGGLFDTAVELAALLILLFLVPKKEETPRDP